MVPTYHLVPRFDIKPAAAGGRIDLGSLIEDLDTLKPIDAENRVPIPQDQLECDHKWGVTVTRTKVRKGEYGIWMKFLEAVAAQLSWCPDMSRTDTIHFKRLDTISFDPTSEYIEQSMGRDDIKDCIDGLGHPPVYMITGLKIGRGPSGSYGTTDKPAFVGEVGVFQPAGLPVEIGPRVNRSKEDTASVDFEVSDDFIIGVQVIRLRHERWAGKLASKEHNRGATLYGDDGAPRNGEDEVLVEELDFELDWMDQERGADENGRSITWVMLKIDDAE